MGDGYVAIKMFIDESNNDISVLEMFKSRIDARELIKQRSLSEKKKLSDESLL